MVLGKIGNRKSEIRNLLLPSVLSLPLGLLAAVLAHYAVMLPWLCRNAMAAEKSVERAFAEAGIPGLVGSFALVCGVGAAGFLAAGLLGFVRRPWALALLRRAYLAAYVIALIYAYLVWRVTGAECVARTSPEGFAPSAMAVMGWRWQFLWPMLCALVAFAALHVTALRRLAVAVYTGTMPAEPLLGDRIVENIDFYNIRREFFQCLFHRLDGSLNIRFNNDIQLLDFSLLNFIVELF